MRTTQISSWPFGPTRLTMVFVVALGLGVASPTSAASMTCEDESGLCMEELKGAKWTPGKKASKKDRKKRSSSKGGTISMTIEGGRGSLFINGRYAGSSPLSGAEIPRGKNDIQVRNGAEVLADGMITVPGGGDIKITVKGG